MSTLANTLYEILHHEATTMVVVVAAAMAVGMGLHAIVVHISEAVAFARIEKKEAKQAEEFELLKQAVAVIVYEMKRQEEDREIDLMAEYYSSQGIDADDIYREAAAFSMEDLPA